MGGLSAGTTVSLVVPVPTKKSLKSSTIFLLLFVVLEPFYKLFGNSLYVYLSKCCLLLSKCFKYYFYCQYTIFYCNIIFFCDLIMVTNLLFYNLYNILYTVFFSFSLILNCKNSYIVDFSFGMLFITF